MAVDVNRGWTWRYWHYELADQPDLHLSSFFNLSLSQPAKTRAKRLRTPALKTSLEPYLECSTFNVKLQDIIQTNRFDCVDLFRVSGACLHACLCPLSSNYFVCHSLTPLMRILPSAAEYEKRGQLLNNLLNWQHFFSSGEFRKLQFLSDLRTIGNNYRPVQFPSYSNQRLNLLLRIRLFLT